MRSQFGGRSCAFAGGGAMKKHVSMFHISTDEMASIRENRSIKDIDFQYNERTWKPIQDAVARIGRDANTCRWPCFPQDACWIEEIVTLRDELERLGRGCLLFAEARKRAATNSDLKKLFTAKAQQAESLRLRLMEEYEPIVGRQITALFSELERILSYQIAIVSSKPSSSKDNASLPHLDYYFHGLSNAWRNIGGPNGGKLLNGFIQACAEPVIGPRSASFRAIDKRIQRLKGTSKNIAGQTLDNQIRSYGG
jgi:hypothetical protein